jgi:hypothetical protein
VLLLHLKQRIGTGANLIKKESRNNKKRETKQSRMCLLQTPVNVNYLCKGASYLEASYGILWQTRMQRSAQHKTWRCDMTVFSSLQPIATSGWPWGEMKKENAGM